MATPDLPEGVDIAIVQDHAAILSIQVELINLTSSYMQAEEGSADEQRGEDLLSAAIGAAACLPVESIGNLLLAMTSMIVATIEPEPAQEWFSVQAAKIAEALDGAS